MKYMVLAAGYGLRARPLTLVRPKVLFPLGQETLLAHLVNNLTSGGFQDGFINASHLSGQIEAAASIYPGLQVVLEESPQGFLVLKRIPMISEGLLLVNGDVYQQIDLAELRQDYQKSPCDALLVVRKRDRPEYTPLQTRNGMFIRTGAGPDDQGFMYSGVAIISRRLQKAVSGPGLFSLINSGAYQVRLFFYQGVWLDLGRPGLYFHSFFSYLRHRGLPADQFSSPGVNIKGARVSNSLLWPESELGAGVAMSNCLVTGGVRIKKGSFSNSILGRFGVCPLQGI